MLGFCLKECVYCCGLGEFVAVLQCALVCLTPVSLSSECDVYSREFINVIYSVQVLGYGCWSGCVPEVCEERVTFVGSVLCVGILDVLRVFMSSRGWVFGWLFFCGVLMA